MVPADSGRVSRARSYSGACPESRRAFAYGAFTLYGDGFHRLPLTRRFVTFRPLCGTIKTGPTTPEWKRPQAIAPSRFGLFPFRSPLLRESIFLSLPPATKMFQFAGLPPPGLFDSTRGDWALPQPGFPIRTSPDQSLLATPRSFTQPATSFIGSWRQGIHPVPFVA